jgi:hypothetical protein
MSVGAVRVRTSTGWRDLAITGPPGPGAITVGDTGSEDIGLSDFPDHGHHVENGQRAIVSLIPEDWVSSWDDPNTGYPHQYLPAPYDVNWGHGIVNWEFRANAEKEVWEYIGGQPVRVERYYSDDELGSNLFDTPIVLVMSDPPEFKYLGPGMWLPWKAYWKASCGAPLSIVGGSVQVMIGDHHMREREASIAEGNDPATRGYTLVDFEHGDELQALFARYSSLVFGGNEGGGAPVRHDAPTFQGYFMEPDIHENETGLSESDLAWEEWPHGAEFVGMYARALTDFGGNGGFGFIAYPWLEVTPIQVPFDPNNAPGPAW